MKTMLLRGVRALKNLLEVLALAGEVTLAVWVLTGNAPG